MLYIRNVKVLGIVVSDNKMYSYVHFISIHKACGAFLDPAV